MGEQSAHPLGEAMAARSKQHVVHEISLNRLDRRRV
jgi:hypothetical protein